MDIEFPKFKAASSETLYRDRARQRLLLHVKPSCRLLSRCGRLRCYIVRYCRLSYSERHRKAPRRCLPVHTSVRMTFDWCELSDQMGFRIGKAVCLSTICSPIPPLVHIALRRCSSSAIMQLAMQLAMQFAPCKASAYNRIQCSNSNCSHNCLAPNALL